MPPFDTHNSPSGNNRPPKSNSREGQDSQHWESLKEGNRSALSHLFRQYYPLLYEYGIKLCRHRELTEDAIQEVFVNLWRRRDQLPRVQSVRSYLLISIRNHLLNQLKGPRQNQENMEGVQDYLPDDAFSPEEMLLIRENASTLRSVLFQAFQQIPPRLREALFLKVYAEMSYREIAPIMGVSPQVARNYVSEAYRRLYELLSENVEFENLRKFLSI